MASRRIRLRYPAACVACGSCLVSGTLASWDVEAKKATCERCNSTLGSASPPTVAKGTPGASAQREYERRKSRHNGRVMEEHPYLGPLILAVNGEPRSTKAWTTGAEGERHVGAVLDQLTRERTVVSHDRRVPKSRANIDHIVVAHSGIWVVDAKRYEGIVERRDVGRWFRRDERLFVNRRDKSSLVESANRQRQTVIDALNEGGNANVRVRTAICFVKARWNPAQPFAIDDVLITWPRALVKTIRAYPDIDFDLHDVTRFLAARFPAHT